MYRKIKRLEITTRELTFVGLDDNIHVIKLPKPIDFRKETSENKNIVVVDNYKIQTYKSNLVCYLDDKLLFKFYMPLPVRYYIVKDIQNKGVFSLEYRKHLRQEYDANKHILIRMNHIPCDSYIEDIQKLSSKYSRGIHNQPIVIVFYNETNNTIHYAIVSENVVVESAIKDIDKNLEFPDLFNEDY